MESTMNRPAVDVGEKSNRPLIALILGILSVPGSTVAWDLPAGGLWIGLPLGIAALVIGSRARRDNGGSTMATIGMVLAALAIAQMAIWIAVSIVT